MPESEWKRDIARHVGEIVAQVKNHTYQSPFHQEFVEIEIENGKDAGNEETVHPSGQPVPVPPPDEKRELFLKMRRLSRNIDFSGVPSDRLQAVLFYKQAKFMESFEDDYDQNAAFSMYFPSYQMMGYEQLRTYFTWRSAVRKGVVRRTSFSFVFVYLYELINNVGVENAADGLEKLVLLWDGYRGYEPKLDRYLNEWVKDYYITNDFDVPFDELLQNNPVLNKLYRRSGPESYFDYYYPYSDYKIERSAFYKPETKKTIFDCFNFVINSLNEFLYDKNKTFDDFVFYGNHDSVWTPFSKALYCSFSRRLKNHTVRFSNTESFRFENGRWTTSQNRIYRKNGRVLIGYIFRRIERFLRKVTKYGHLISADRNKIDINEIAARFADPESLFEHIDQAIFAYYRLSTRVVVTVDETNLEKIRENAEITKNKLLVDQEEPEPDDYPAQKPAVSPQSPAIAENTSLSEEPDDIWKAFARSLDKTEKTAVRMVLKEISAGELEAFSKESNVMLEVLIDNINQKAMDTMGDGVFDFSEQVTVFEDYKEDLKRVMDIESQ